MTPRPSATAAIRKRLQMHGVDIALQHYEEADSGRGTIWQESEEETIKAYPSYSGSSSTLGELLGIELQEEMAFAVLADDVSDDLRDGGHDGATDVTYDGRSYVVEQVEDLKQGTVTLHCSTLEEQS